MAVKKYKPTSPGRRGMSSNSFDEITSTKPEKSLLAKKSKAFAGRNGQGKVTVRHRGGGHKQRLRVVDFKRDKIDIPAKVASIDYDPGRSANLALLHYADGEKRYILAPVGLKVGDTVISGEKADITPNCLPIANIPTGTMIHNIEMKEGKGGQMVRSAGAAAQLNAKEGDYAQIRMPSGEVRLIRQTCYATIGQVGNVDHGNVKLGKAGRKRHRGIRPTVRGSAMSPKDHPHGGGEGRSPIGMASPKSPWGKPTLGKKTRRNKQTDQYIVRERRRGKKRR